MGWFERIEELADLVAGARNCDVFLYFGDVSETGAQDILTECRKSARSEAAFLVLGTFGGDPDGGYQIARTLQRHYRKLTVFVPGRCKSAGTLVCVGAHELVMGNCAELGPLDMQLRNRNEIKRQDSGLDFARTFDFLQERAN